MKRTNNAIALTVTHTRQFAKRQRTWFNKNQQIAWFDNTIPDLTEKVWDLVQEFVTRCSR